jgi:hypothetical protein
MSPLLSALRERTSSVIPAAAAHGTFNALALPLLLFAPGADRVLAGPVGALGAAVLLLIGVALWWPLLRTEPGALTTPERSLSEDGVRPA